jgi:hypothetical protein
MQDMIIIDGDQHLAISDRLHHLLGRGDAPTLGAPGQHTWAHRHTAGA